MFRQAVASILIFAFLVTTFTRPFIMLGYYADTSVYAKDCINKAKPKMHCNGHCQVMKKIQEEEKKEQKDQDRKADNKIETLSSKSFFCTVAPAYRFFVSSPYSPGIFRNPVEMPRSFFHPPSA